MLTELNYILVKSEAAFWLWFCQTSYVLAWVAGVAFFSIIIRFGQSLICEM